MHSLSLVLYPSLIIVITRLPLLLLIITIIISSSSAGRLGWLITGTYFHLSSSTVLKQSHSRLAFLWWQFWNPASCRLSVDMRNILNSRATERRKTQSLFLQTQRNIKASISHLTSTTADKSYLQFCRCIYSFHFNLKVSCFKCVSYPLSKTASFSTRVLEYNPEFS